MDVSGWLDFPKLNGTSVIRKARKWLSVWPKTYLQSTSQSSTTQSTSPSTESTGWLVSAAPGQTHYSAVSEVCSLSTNPGNFYNFLHKAVWVLPNKDASPQTLLSYCRKHNSTIWSQVSALTRSNTIAFLKAGDKPTFSGEHSLCS